MSKKVLVTGAIGFIGYHLVEKLLAENYSVVGIDNINSYYDVRLKYAKLPILGKKAIINYLAIRPGDVVKTYSDVSSLKGDFGYKPQVNIRLGLTHFIEWHKTL